MGKTLYLECYSGISGDMTVAALLDLGADRLVLDRVLKSLKVSGFETKISRVVKSGIDACDFDVVLDKEHENHDHDMEYLHGHHHEGHESNHAHGTGTAQDHHHHEHRGIKEITYIIEHSAMTENAKKIALRIFEILAEAESKAHNVPVDQVHFHEVGAVDSVVDIVSVAVCLDDLDVTEVIVPVLCEGRGTVRSKASSTALCTASIARAKIRGTFFCFNRATTRIDAPKFSPIATITISTLFNGNTDNDCSSVASMTKAVATLSLMESTRLSLISAPIISCPKADSSSANTWP